MAKSLYLDRKLSPVLVGEELVGIARMGEIIHFPKPLQKFLKGGGGPYLDIGTKKVVRALTTDGVRFTYRGSSVTIPYSFLDSDTHHYSAWSRF